MLIHLNNIHITLRKGTRYGWGDDLSSDWRRPVNSSGSIFASFRGREKKHQKLNSVVWLLFFQVISMYISLAKQATISRRTFKAEVPQLLYIYKILLSRADLCNMLLRIQGVPLGMHNFRHNEIPQTLKSFFGIPFSC